MLERFHFLSKKYPFSTLSLKKAGLFSGSVFIILFSFQPFGLSNYEGSKLMASLMFGLICFANLLFANYVVKYQMKKIGNPTWTILKEILYCILVLGLISTSNFLYFIFCIDKSIFNFYVFLYFFIITTVIGSFPIIIVVLTKHNYILKNKLYQIIGDEDLEKKKEDVIITFQSLNKSDQDFSLPLEHFLFFEVIKNNIYIYYIEGEGVITKIIRNTLTNVMEDVLNYKNIFRCHRSYVINLNNVINAKGNSNGYKLVLKHHENKIPVSRQYTGDFQSLFY